MKVARNNHGKLADSKTNKCKGIGIGVRKGECTGLETVLVEGKTFFKITGKCTAAKTDGKSKTVQPVSISKPKPKKKVKVTKKWPKDNGEGNFNSTLASCGAGDMRLSHFDEDELILDLQLSDDDGISNSSQTYKGNDNYPLSKRNLSLNARAEVNAGVDEVPMNDAGNMQQIELELQLSERNALDIIVETPTGLQLNIKISNLCLVEDIHDLLMDRSETCHYTCFSLKLNAVTLHPQIPLKSLKSLTEHAKVKMVEEIYTIREIRLHIRHMRKILKSMSTSNSFNGVECSSLSLLHTITHGDLLDKKKSHPECIDCTPQDYVMPGVCEPPLTPLLPTPQYAQCEHTLKVLTTSAWNPPPGARKLQGDLMYLYVLTMEGKRMHVTASQKGFYVNKSTNETFNAKMDNPSYFSPTLTDMLLKASPAFRRAYQQIQQRRNLSHRFEHIPTPFQVFQWVAPGLEDAYDALRGEDSYPGKLSDEDWTQGKLRDWNEELQSMRELPRNTHKERIVRDEAIFKVHIDFVDAAVRGAVAVIDGNVLALNPNENRRMQMYIVNNIFFSPGFDVCDHYKALGGDYAAFVAPRHDLCGVRVYGTADVEGLHTLGTVLIDYRGYRISAQTIIPGTLEHKEEQAVVYGSVGFHKTVHFHPKYVELLAQATKYLHIAPHWVLNETNEPVMLTSSVECNGIIGTDKRYYILDLLRTFPPDVNFLPQQELELSDAMQLMGFPIQHRHTLCCLRQELIEAYAMELQNRPKDANGDTQPKFPGFNPDVFALGIRHVDMPESPVSLAEQKRHVRDASEFVVLTQIPRFINEHLSHSSPPMDGNALTAALHRYGINVRYMGNFIEQLALVPRLEYLHRIAVTELIVRATKHIYFRFIQNSLPVHLSMAISHFLNCFLSSAQTSDSEEAETDDCGISKQNVRVKAKFNAKNSRTGIANDKRKKNKEKDKEIRSVKTKLKPGGREQNANNATEFEANTSKLLTEVLSHDFLWYLIQREAMVYWNFELVCNSAATLVTIYNLQRVSLMRSFCKRVGIQVCLREYDFDACLGPTFTDEDIINIFPIVKQVCPLVQDGAACLKEGQTRLQKGEFQDGYNYIAESLNMFNEVYGPMHVENIVCMHTLARISYVLDKADDALALQQRATLISERVNGIDHPNTILEYLNLAIFAYAKNQISMSLKLFYRARYLISLLSSEDHPAIARVDSNIGLILHAVRQHELAVYYLENALKLNMKYFGNKSTNAAISYHLLARNYACLADFRAALRNERECYSIYKTRHGEVHQTTRQSELYLRQLTRQAVVVHRRTSSFSCGNRGTLPTNKEITMNLSPLKTKILIDILNCINGVLFPEIPASLYTRESSKVKQRIESIYEPAIYERSLELCAAGDSTLTLKANCC